VTDSSQFRGYIVDVLVVNRDWLLKNEAVVLDVLGSYFRSAYHYRDSMVDLVVSDARLTGTPITQPQAQKLVEGIWWKNTQENFAHFGIQTGQSLQLLEDMIGNIVRVLNTTRAIERDPTGGQPNLLYYDNPLLTLKNNQFHPGLESETIRDDTIKLLRLDDAGWNSLVPVGTLSVPPLVFARGTARLTSSSKAVLDDLVTTLKSLPRAYVLVNGNASLRGELEANQRLAMQRAQAAEKYLIAAGVDENRIRAVAGQPSGSTSVSFVLGQLPY
jgi:flagellar motor protein MotB